MPSFFAGIVFLTSSIIFEISFGNVPPLVSHSTIHLAIPQLYVKEEFIGGCDIVKEMHETGELLELFNSRGIDVKPS